ncbi:MAG: CDP-glycerol glycerophosphotransferase family protein [Leptolyngbyaceae cyanobacterium MO_188.B28]|nr:CDP-glycerol glycerophosphotransferase family protein [Leptolyngbyaceae cyanobacterium MO_188.B28]
MLTIQPITVLFTGYAPVHFLCFRPLYEQLVRLAGVKVYVSGGLRTQAATGYHYDGAGMYAPFPIPPEQILSVDEIQNRRFDVLFSANKRIILPPENVGVKIQIFHGVSFRNRGVRVENLVYDFFFLIGPYMQRKFVETGLLTADDPRGVPIGFPKTDPLLMRDFDRKAMLSKYGFDGKRPILLYAPTGQADNSLEIMGKEIIQRLATTDQYDLLIKPHDHPKDKDTDWFVELEPYENDHTRVVRALDIVPLLRLSDLLITDASSMANEYALLNRPLVFLDVPELIQRAKDQGAFVDETLGRRGGLLVERPDQIEEIIATSLANSEEFSEIRQGIAQDLFYNPGGATEAAIEWFTRQFLGKGEAGGAGEMEKLSVDSKLLFTATPTHPH